MSAPTPQPPIVAAALEAIPSLVTIAELAAANVTAETKKAAVLGALSQLVATVGNGGDVDAATLCSQVAGRIDEAVTQLHAAGLFTHRNPIAPGAEGWASPQAVIDAAEKVKAASQPS